MVRLVAKPAPYTMTQEYQEETNEFLKVRSVSLTRPPSSQLTRIFRTKKPIPSLVSPLLAMPARVWSSLLPRATKFNTQRRFFCARSLGDSTETYWCVKWPLVCVGMTGGFEVAPEISSPLGVNTVLQQRNPSRVISLIEPVCMSVLVEVYLKTCLTSLATLIRVPIQ